MMTSIGGTRRNTVAGGEGSLRDHLGSMFTGQVLPRCPTITFPQSSIIYADSLQQAHKILKDQGYFVVSSEEVELFKASANQEINFKSATKGLTPAFSELRFKREEGKKTFFAKDYKKLRIKIGERGETTDWILMKQAKRCSTSFIINNSKALGGPVTTNSLHGQNSNHEKEKAVDGWRRERKKLKQALKNSPAYIRGRLDTPAKRKPKEKRERKGDRGGIKSASAVKQKQVLKTNTRKTEGGKGGNDPCQFSKTVLPLRLRGGGKTADGDGGSSSDSDAYLSAEEELSLSPTPYEEAGGCATDPGSSDEDGLDYRSQGSEQGALLDIEFQQTETEEGEDCDQVQQLMSGEGGMEVADNILVEGVDICMDTSDAAGGGEVKSGAQHLRKIDKNFMSSPRMVVRGRYCGKGLELIVRRKTEGTYVDWSLFNTRTKKQALLVHGEMNYPFQLTEESLRHPDKFGREVLGGWVWQGWGYGYLNLNRIDQSFPQDPRLLHVDIEEGVYGGEEIFYHVHVSGRSCLNENHSEDVDCQQEGCGIVIWRIKFATFTTAEDESNSLANLGLAPPTLRKEREEQILFLSLVNFFNGETKIALHKEAELKSEEVMWLTKDGIADDSVAAVDRLKISRAKMIWETRVPKSQVNIL